MEYDVLRVSITVGFSGLEPLRFSEISDKATEIGYRLPTGKTKAIAFDESGQHIMEKMEKENVEIAYIADEAHLTIASDSIDVVTDTLDEIRPLIDEVMNGFPTTDWYEFNLNARVYTSKHSMEVNNKSDSKLISLLNKGTGLSMKPYTKAICAHGDGIPQKPLNTIPDWLHLSFGPYVRNPRDYFLNLVYRRPNFNDVKSIIEKVDEIILDVVESDW